jgi:hypothetical protein
MASAGPSSKVTPGDPAWKTFEKDVAAFVAAFDPSATVEHDVRRSGRYSGRKRQVDVLVTGTVGDSAIEVAIECKRNTTNKIGIKVVDEFVGKIIDVSADRGVLCAFGGFDKGAVARAKGAVHPKIELRDLSHWDLLPDWSDIAADFLRADCPNSDCWGEISWGDFSDEDGNPVQAGHCESCGSLVGECSICGTKTALELDEMGCDSCEATWTVTWADYQHDGIEFITLNDRAEEKT